MRFIVLLAACLGCAPAWAEDAEVRLGSTVTGSREQPRVMHLVPWQQPPAADFDYRLGSGLADELFAPVDRDEFVRGLHYRQTIAGDSDRAAPELNTTQSLAIQGK